MRSTARTPCTKCTRLCASSSLYTVPAQLAVSKDGYQDVNGRDVISTLSVVAWKRYCYAYSCTKFTYNVDYERNIEIWYMTV